MYSQLYFIDKNTEVLAMENPAVWAPKGTLTCSNLGSESHIWPRCKWKSGQKNSLINCQMASIWPCFCFLTWQTAEALATWWRGQSALEETLPLLCLTGWVGPTVHACLFLKEGRVLLWRLFFHGCWNKVTQTFGFKQKLEPDEVTHTAVSRQARSGRRISENFRLARGTGWVPGWDSISKRKSKSSVKVFP